MNARTKRHSRMLMIERLQAGWSAGAIAVALGVTVKTVRKWRDRFDAKGETGLTDRSSWLHHSPTQLDNTQTRRIEALRRERLTGAAIACQLRHPLSTIGAILRRLGLGRLAALDPRPPFIRYERERPGEMIHIDIKNLAASTGSAIASPAIAPAKAIGAPSGAGLAGNTCTSPSTIDHDLPSRRCWPANARKTPPPSIRSSLAWFKNHGVTVERVMTDNGSAYKSFAFRNALTTHDVQHKRTRPYTPRTNGKAERFIQTSIRKWAYATPFQSSAERTAAMHPWLHAYNTARPHAALNGHPPVTRLLRNNVLGSDRAGCRDL